MEKRFFNFSEVINRMSIVEYLEFLARFVLACFFESEESVIKISSNSIDWSTTSRFFRPVQINQSRKKLSILLIGKNNLQVPGENRAWLIFSGKVFCGQEMVFCGVFRVLQNKFISSVAILKVYSTHQNLFFFCTN